jgi:hypothetical protein
MALRPAAPALGGRWGRVWLLVLLPLLATAAVAEAFDYTFVEDTAEAPFNASCVVRATQGWGAAEARIAFNYQDQQNHYYARLTGATVEVHKVKAGRDAVIGTPSALQPSSLGSEIQVTLQRRAWRIGVLCDGLHAVEAFDDEFAGGRVGYGASAGVIAVAAGDPPVQPVGDIEVEDTFVREADSGEWTAVEGSWQTGGLADQEKPELAANPFSYTAKGPGTAMSVAGYWFWDDYAFSAAAKGVGDGAIGLIVRYQDPKNFLMVRWVGARGGGYSGREKQLIRVRNGKWAILEYAEGGFVPGEWYHLQVRVSGGMMECFIDGQLVLRRRDVDFRQGQVGLYAAGDLSRAYFDDVQVRPIARFADDFSTPTSGKWQAYGGAFGYHAGTLLGKAPNGTAVAVAGESDWRDLTLGCDVEAKDGGVGLCFGWRDPRNYYAFRWGGPAGSDSQGKKQLVRVADGAVQVIAQSGGGFEPGRRYRLKVEAERGYVAAYVDNRLVLQAAGVEIPAGKVGLLADGCQQATYRDLFVWRREPETYEPIVTEQFAKEDTMSHWARPEGTWTAAEGSEGLYWHLSPFFADHWAEAAIPRIGSAAGSLRLILAGDGTDPDSGYSLTLDCQQGADRATATLRRAASVVAQAEVLPGEGETTAVRLERRGECLLAFVNDRCAAAFQDPQPLGGRRLGVRFTGLPADLSKVRARGSHLLDYTFSEAPSDWIAERGEWRVRTRWPCQPGWAWFGTNRNAERKEAPIVWNKRRFEGDLTLEVYMALIMDMPKEPGYTSPSDLNCTICGDGRFLKSGYSFIYAGWNNTSSRMLRQEQVVAQRDDVKFDNPVSMNIDFQRHWFYVRVDKIGGKVLYSVDGKPVFEYDDPRPLDGGKVALWTYNNGLSVARVRIAYERGGQVTPVRYPWPTEDEARQDVPYILYRD